MPADAESQIPGRTPRRSQALWCNCARALLVFVAALAFYLATAWVFRHWQAKPVYFDHLADAFLHGRLYLDPPPGTHDLSEFDGRWYVPFPPLPALLMLPFVATGGVNAVHSVLFSIGLAAASVALVSVLLDGLARRRVVRLDRAGRLWIVLLFMAGTVQWYVAVEGSVWFISQTCTVLFLALAANLALARRSPLPASLALGLAMLARPHVLLTWPLLFALGRAAAGETRGTGRSWAGDWKAALWRRRRWVAGSLAGPALACAGLGVYNAARFGNPLDFGYYSQKIEASLMDPLFSHGQFSIDHLARNLWLVLFHGQIRDRWTGRETPDDQGMSVILTTPALLWILFALLRRDPVARGAWLAAGLTLVPLLLYYNTGWRQFGYRFILDLIVPLIVLVAIAAGRRINSVLGALIVASVWANVLGTFWWFTEVSIPSGP